MDRVLDERFSNLFIDTSDMASERLGLLIGSKVPVMLFLGERVDYRLRSAIIMSAKLCRNDERYMGCLIGGKYEGFICLSGAKGRYSESVR